MVREGFAGVRDTLFRQVKAEFINNEINLERIVNVRLPL